MSTPPGMREMSEAECWAALRSNEQPDEHGAGGVGRLAVAIANRPDVFPVNYVVDHGSIVFRTAEGTKLAASVLGTSVAFEIDGYDVVGGEAWSVVVKGRAVEIDQVHGKFDAADLPLFPWHAGPKHRIVRIVPETTSGRHFRVVDRSAQVE